MDARVRHYCSSQPGILHPSQVDFSIPFEYLSSLYEETYNPSQDGGYISPDALGRGIAFWPPLIPDEPKSVVSQLKLAVQPTANNRLMLSSRITIDHPSTSILVGLWATDGDPFGEDGSLAIGNGIVIHGVNREGTPFNDLYGVCIAEGEAADPTFLIETTEDNFYDVAVVFHRGQAAEFLFVSDDKTWSSVVLTANLPNVELRPSVGALRGPQLGGLVVRSFQVSQREMG